MEKTSENEHSKSIKQKNETSYTEEIEGVKISGGRKAFYNPAQKFNRDISILVVKNFLKPSTGARVLEAMSASGIRGIRYAKELGENTHIFFNDFDSGSVDEIKRNIALNSLHPGCYTISKSDCNSLMMSYTSYFDVIDIDPFGSYNLFIESAIKAIKHNGLLAVTATDTAVLCSNQEKCLSKYNTVIKRNPACHEHALRTVLSFIARAASRYNAGIEPLISISVDFYVRLFVKVVKNKARAKESAASSSFFLLCDCFSFQEIAVNKKAEFSSKCRVCSRSMKLCGPFWSREIHSKEFVRDLQKCTEDTRLVGILNVISLEMDIFGYFSISDMSKFVKCDAVSMKNLVCAISNAGYSASLTHCKLNALKTDAPPDFLYAAILKNSKKNREGLSLGAHEISFEYNRKATSIRDPKFYRGTLFSHMGPISKKGKS